MYQTLRCPCEREKLIFSGILFMLRELSSFTRNSWMSHLVSAEIPPTPTPGKRARVEVTFERQGGQDFWIFLEWQ